MAELKSPKPCGRQVVMTHVYVGDELVDATLCCDKERKLRGFSNGHYLIMAEYVLFRQSRDFCLPDPGMCTIHQRCHRPPYSIRAELMHHMINFCTREEKSDKTSIALFEKFPLMAEQAEKTHKEMFPEKNLLAVQAKYDGSTDECPDLHISEDIEKMPQYNEYCKLLNVIRPASPICVLYGKDVEYKVVFSELQHFIEPKKDTLTILTFLGYICETSSEKYICGRKDFFDDVDFDDLYTSDEDESDDDLEEPEIKKMKFTETLYNWV